jgi:hypothetical protein
MMQIPVRWLKNVRGVVHGFDDRPAAIRRPRSALCGIGHVGRWWHDYAETDKVCKKCIERLKTLQRFEDERISV